MRFENLVWSLLALLLVGRAAWETRSPAGDATTADPVYQAADGGSDIPPPTLP